MAAKSKDKDGKEEGKVKTKKLKLSKVTVGELSESELNKVQGGVRMIKKN
jgi:natural product precursor